MPTTYKGKIAGISGHPMSGLWQVLFENGRSCHIESGCGVRALARCFGAVEGTGDLLDKTVGQEIVYSVDEIGVLMGFTPIDDWEGPDIPEEGIQEDMDEDEIAEVRAGEIE